MTLSSGMDEALEDLRQIEFEEAAECYAEIATEIDHTGGDLATQVLRATLLPDSEPLTLCDLDESAVSTAFRFAMTHDLAWPPNSSEENVRAFNDLVR